MRPIVAVVAAEEPETAAKIPQLTTFMCIKRPGNPANQGDKPSNISLANRVR